MAGRPPAKSNRYKLEWSRRLRRWVIAKDDEVKGYERALGEQTKLLLNRLGVDPPWFPKHVDLELTILWHRGDDNARHRKDVGNIDKSIQDALNRLAWADDCQVAELHIRRVHDAASVEEEWVEISVRPLDP
jgi:endodeoxyribonuclease RusA